MQCAWNLLVFFFKYVYTIKNYSSSYVAIIIVIIITIPNYTKYVHTHVTKWLLTYVGQVSRENRANCSCLGTTQGCSYDRFTGARTENTYIMWFYLVYPDFSCLYLSNLACMCKLKSLFQHLSALNSLVQRSGSVNALVQGSCQ